MRILTFDRWVFNFGKHLNLILREQQFGNPFKELMTRFDLSKLQLSIKINLRKFGTPAPKAS